MNFLQRLVYAPPGGQFRESTWITTRLDPVDLSLYQQLIPEPFSMPDSPAITLFVFDYLKVSPWPLTRYQEWGVSLQCNFNGQSGWHVLTIPVTSWIAMQGGRYLGFPKYVADQIHLKQVDQCWKAESRHRGILKLEIEFEPGINRQLSPLEEDLVLKVSRLDDILFLLQPPGTGPVAQKITLNHIVPPEYSPVPGMARIQVDRSERLAGLLPENIYSLAVLNHFKGGMNLVHERLN